MAFEAGSCCFPFCLPGNILVMLFSAPLWVQTDEARCALCAGGVMLAYAVTCALPVCCALCSGVGFHGVSHPGCAVGLCSQERRVCFGVRGCLESPVSRRCSVRFKSQGEESPLCSQRPRVLTLTPPHFSAFLAQGAGCQLRC